MGSDGSCHICFRTSFYTFKHSHCWLRSRPYKLLPGQWRHVYTRWRKEWFLFCLNPWDTPALSLSHSEDQCMTDLKQLASHCSHCLVLQYLKRLNVVNEALISAGQPILAEESLTCREWVYTLSSLVLITERDSSICETCREVWPHAVTAYWEGCFSAGAMPDRAVLERCQTAWRAFAQTVTPLPLTTTDGVSHAYCVEGYVTPRCVLNLIWTTQTRMQRDTRADMHEQTHGEEERGCRGINQATVEEII